MHSLFFSNRSGSGKTLLYKRIKSANSMLNAKNTPTAPMLTFFRTALTWLIWRLLSLQGQLKHTTRSLMMFADALLWEFNTITFIRATRMVYLVPKPSAVLQQLLIAQMPKPKVQA